MAFFLNAQDVIIVSCERTIEAELAKDLQNNERFIITKLDQAVKNEKFGIRTALDDLKNIETSPDFRQIVKTVLDNVDGTLLETYSKFNEGLASPYLNLLQKIFIGTHMTYISELDLIIKYEIELLK